MKTLKRIFKTRQARLEYYRQQQAEWRKKNPRKYQHYNPERARVTRIVCDLIDKGKLIRPCFCSACGMGRIILGHHEDYTKPDQVIWVCNSCHQKIHLFKRYGRSLADAFKAIKNPREWTFIKRGPGRGIWETRDNFGDDS